MPLSAQHNSRKATYTTIVGNPALFSLPPHCLSGVPCVRTSRAVPRLPSARPHADGGEVLKAAHRSSERVAGNTPYTPVPPKQFGLNAPSSPLPDRRRWLPRWFYVGCYPFLLAVASYALFAGGYLDFEPAKGAPRWLTPLLLALSFSLPTGWLILTSSERWRALPAWLRCPGWLVAGWWYSMRFAYWPSLLLQIVTFTGMEGGRLVDCRGRTLGGVVRFVPSSGATLDILCHWAAFHGGWDALTVAAIQDSLPQLIPLYQMEGAAAVQMAVGGVAPFPIGIPLFVFDVFVAGQMDWSWLADLVAVGLPAVDALWQWGSWMHLKQISIRWSADRPPTDLSSLCSEELCGRLSKWDSLYLFPLLTVALDPFQYGLPVDLLLERALHYLEALLAEDNLFAPHTLVEPPAYPEKPEPAPTFKWGSPSSWWDLLYRWWRK